MSLGRTILVAFLALLFVVATNRCVLASALRLNAEAVACCEEERAPAQPMEEGPCGVSCAACAFLESGVNLAALTPLKAASPVWREDSLLSELLQRMARELVSKAMPAPPDRATIPPPQWQLAVKKGLPVRGPSVPA